MERITTEDDATNRLTRLTQAGSNPVITSDLSDILAECRLATLWVAATAYAVGDVVQPNTPNGHRYICIQGGTSGTTEPDWLASDWLTAGLSVSNRDTRITEGTSDPILTWREDGPEYASLWDMRAAAYKGWKLKASLAVCAIDTSGDGQSFKNSEIFDHCEAMARKFTPVMAG